MEELNTYCDVSAYLRRYCNIYFGESGGKVGELLLVRPIEVHDELSRATKRVE